MDNDVIIAHLRARCPTFAQRVAGAAEYAAARESTALAVPFAFVIPVDDEPEPNAAENGISQRLVETFGVVVAVSNATDERGQASAKAIHQVRAELWAALLGWRPTPQHGLIAYEGGNLLGLDRARMWWQFEFSTDFYIDDSDGWLQAQQQALPRFEGADIKVDVIDPIAQPRPGPDGRTEFEAQVNNLPE